MYMSEDFVTYEQAKILKELGFDWECNHVSDESSYIYEETSASLGESNYHDFNHEDIYENDISAPTLAQVQKWLRKTKKIFILIDIRGRNEKEFCWKIFNSETFWTYGSDDSFDTYEEALSVGIDKALELLNKK